MEKITEAVKNPSSVDTKKVSSEVDDDEEIALNKIIMEMDIGQDIKKYRMGYFLTRKSLEKMFRMGMRMLTGGPKTKRNILQAFNRLKLKGEIKPCLEARVISKGKYQKGSALYCV